MKRKLLVMGFVLFIVSAVPLAASYPTIAPDANVKGMYYKGKVHIVTPGNRSSPTYQDKIVHVQETPSPSSWKFDTYATPTATISLPSNCWGLWEGGTGIMNDKIYCSMTLWIGSSNATSVPWLYCAVYDLTANTFTLTQLCQVNIASDPDAFVQSALAVFQDKVYIFTNTVTVASSDGLAWATQPSVLTPDDHLSPVDAIAFYPMGDAPASVMLLCADSTNHYDGGAYAVIWNGPSSAQPISKTKFSSAGMYAGALFTGTVKPPSSGSGSKYHAGAKHPCIQAFINQDIDYGCVRYEYDLATQMWLMDAYTNDSDASYGFFGFVTYQDECTANFNNLCDQRQYIGINGLDSNMNWHYWAFTSDAMVPEQCDPAPNGYGWQGLPTATSAATPTLMKYWSLIGVILGPPPFAVNDTTDDYALRNMSNVIYGADTSTEVTHSQTTENTVTVSADAKLKGGVKNEFGVSMKLDEGFKWAWEQEHQESASTSLGYYFKCGTAGDAEGEWGTRGKALFNSPNLVTQWYKMYAYDYDVSTNTGTYLNQDLNTIQALGMVIQSEGFDLATPGGNSDDVPGLLSGIPPYPYATDLDGWHAQTWEKSFAPWVVKFGTGAYGGVPVTQLKQGTPGGITFTQDNTTIDSSGSTTGASIGAGVKLSVGSELNGFSAGVTAGYDCQFSTNTEVSTQVSKNIECDLEMSYTSGTDPDYVRSMTVQPYWLLATDYSAPWIPTGYSGQLPWCMTWCVVAYDTVGGKHVGPSPAPDSSSVGVDQNGPGAVAWEGESTPGRWSSFTLEGGSLSWLEEGGGTTPIPLTAETFDPAIGSVVKVAGYALPTDQSRGRWTRNGDVWTFKTKEKSPPPAMTLKLDFGNRTWSADVKKVLLASSMPAGTRHARVSLVVNEKYTFYCDLQYDLSLHWKQALQPPGPGKLGIAQFAGSYDSKYDDGDIQLSGLLPASSENFGDISFAMNRASIMVPLLSMEEYLAAREKGKELVYKREGLIVKVDFGKKKWSASIKEGSFSALQVPKSGKALLELRVGGDVQYSKACPIDLFKARLTFKRP